MFGDSLQSRIEEIEKAGKFYLIRLVAGELNQLGMAIPFLQGTSIYAKCIWGFENEEEGEKVTKEINKKYLQRVVKLVGIRYKKITKKHSYFQSHEFQNMNKKIQLIQAYENAF